MIWLYPTRSPAWPDYPTEAHSLHGVWWSIGWPYETAAAMCRWSTRACSRPTPACASSPTSGRDDPVLLGTDMPLGGPGVVADTIADAESLSLPEAQRRQVYAGNARSLFTPGTVPEHFA